MKANAPRRQGSQRKTDGLPLGSKWSSQKSTTVTRTLIGANLVKWTQEENNQSRTQLQALATNHRSRNVRTT